MPLETLLNHYISMDSNAIQKLKPLKGNVLKLIIKPVTLFVLFDEEKIRLQTSSERPPDTTLEGDPLSFIKLQFADKNHLFSLFKHEMRISGDLNAGQQAKAFFENIDIDWEEHLSKLTGDIVAHQLASLLKRTQSFSTHLFNTNKQNLTDYLQEETRLLPCKEELSDFYDDVDALRLRVDRLLAKATEIIK